MKNVRYNWISYEKCAPPLESLRKPTLQTACGTWAPAGGEKNLHPKARWSGPKIRKKHTIQTRPAGESGEKHTIQAVRAENPKKKLTIQPVLLGCWLVALSTTHAEAPCGGKHVRYNWNPNEKCAVQLDFL